MKNIIYIKKLDPEVPECGCCMPKDLIKDIELMVDRQLDLVLLENENYELYLDITQEGPDPEGYRGCFLENEPILDELNEYYDFLIDGTITKNDFDILLDDKSGVFESETDLGASCYKIIGQAQDEYLVAKDIYFYIGKIREELNGKFLIVYCEAPYLCEEIGA